jgi:hypothetical protein
MVAAEGSPSNLAWSSRSPISKLVKEFLQRPSVDECRPTRAAAMVRNPVEIGKKRMVPATAVVIETTAEMMIVEMVIARTDSHKSVAHLLCLRFHLLGCLDSRISQYRRFPTVCRCFLLDLFSPVKVKPRHNHLPQDIVIEYISEFSSTFLSIFDHKAHLSCMIRLSFSSTTLASA